MIRQYVAFGDITVNRLCDGDFDNVKQMFDDCPNCLGYRDFKTEEERVAYVRGLNDAVGWMECYPLDKEEEKWLSEHVNLSEIYDLGSEDL